MVDFGVAKSSKKQKRGKPLLELRLSHPTSPRVVAEAAQLMASMFDAVAPRLSDDAVTLVISNLDMKARFVSYSQAGNKAVKTISLCLSKPEKSIEKSAEGREIARCVIESRKALVEYNMVVQRLDTKKKESVEITSEYVKRLETLVASAPKIGLRGTTTVVSKILRIGFRDEGKQLQARILIDGKPKDVPVDVSKKATLADQFKTGIQRRIKLDVRWCPNLEGAMVIDRSTARIVDIDTSWSPTSGREVAEAIRQLGPGMFENADELLADIEGA